MKFQVFDVDRSLKSVGSETRVTEMCGGFPPVRIYEGMEQITTLLAKLFVLRDKPQTHPLFGEIKAETEESKVYVMRKKVAETELGLLFFDSLTHATRQSREALRKSLKENEKTHRKSLTQADWGDYGNMVMEAIDIITKLPIPVVMTCHMDVDDTLEEEPVKIPGVKGGSKYQVTEYFDVVLYSTVEVDEDGKRHFLWITEPDPVRIYAKNRGGLLPPKVYHNLKEILELYAANDMPDVKILIIAHSGHGKTHSLTTINDPKVHLNGEPIRKNKEQSDADV